MHNFKDFMEKEPYKFYKVLISSHEIMWLPNFESIVSEVIPANTQTFHPWFSLHIFVKVLWSL